MIEQTYRIDMIPDGAPVVVHVSQYDTAARRLSFELYNGGVAYELPAGAVASIAGTKPDNTSFLYAMTVSGNLVSIDLQQQMALVAGDVPAEIQITGAEGKIGSANFIIRVERGPIDENSVISETDLPIFEQLVSDAQEAASDAHTAADTASAAATSVSAILPASSGTPWQVLTKTATGADWQDVDGLPAGGTAGQVLTKNSSTDGDASWATIASCPFPIGFGGFFKDNPNTIYSGTTWEQKKDVFVLAAGDTYGAGSTGGEAQHSLNIDEMPSHRHSSSSNMAGYASSTTGNDTYVTWVNTGTAFGNEPDTGDDGAVRTSWVGGSRPHNNMPPYFAMPFWVRTA